MGKQLKILYIDAISGISGDMLLGAFVDLGVPFSLLEDVVHSFNVPTLDITRQEVRRNGFRATKVDVKVPQEHVHRHLSHILEMISDSSLTARAKEIATNIFKRLATAEAKVHGTTPEEVHFHEIGAADSIADISGIAAAIDHLSPDKIMASSIPTGTGTIKIAHGLCSIPAPATAELLKGIPIAPSDIPFELTTPTGAAFLAVLVKDYGPIPNMIIKEIGIGAGFHEFEQQPNILRLIKGSIDIKDDNIEAEEELWMLETNLDDVSGEIIGFVQEKIRGLNPKEVFTTSIQMKKQRPGVKLSILAEKSQLDKIERILFEETPTLGIRRYPVQRTTLDRQICNVETPWGTVSGKIANFQGHFLKFKPEYEEISSIAIQNNIPIQIVNQEALYAFKNNKNNDEN